MCRIMTKERDTIDNSAVHCEIGLGVDSNSKVVTVEAERDFVAVARLHAEGITEGFLSTLGLRFLSTLYAGIRQAPGGNVLVVKQEGSVLGFVAYTSDVASCYRWVLTRRFLPLAFALLPNLLNPSIHRKCVETLTYPFRHKSGSEEAQRGAVCEAEMLAIAVSGEARGRGVGKRLVAVMEEDFLRMGIAQYRVMTHALDPRSNGFYRGCGFRLRRTLTNHGKPMNEYVREIQKLMPALQHYETEKNLDQKM